MEENTPYLYSLYLKDSSKLDGNCETIMDYTISWTLRRAQEEYRNEKPILFKYCREILAKMLGLELQEELLFLSVKTWKQSSRIDLWVEVELSLNGIKQKHSILMENKYYTKLHTSVDIDGESRNQLIVYKRKFDDYYKDLKEYTKHYLLITCMDRYDSKFSIYDEAEDYGFTTYTLEELYDYDYNYEGDSESDIFNEFWRRHW